MTLTEQQQKGKVVAQFIRWISEEGNNPSKMASKYMHYIHAVEASETISKSLKKMFKEPIDYINSLASQYSEEDIAVQKHYVSQREEKFDLSKEKLNNFYTGKIQLEGRITISRE